jgi:hypothetical protein
MKVLHVGQFRSAAPGVAAQMLQEQLAAERAGLPWTSHLFVPKGCTSNAVCVEAAALPDEKQKFKREFFQWLGGAVENFDLVLLRHSLFSLGQARFLESCSIPVYLVHHTLEVPELLSDGGFKAWARAVAEGFFGRMSLRRSHGVVGVTPEILSYEVSRAGKHLPTLLYPNGVNYREADDLLDTRHGRIPELVFIASEFVPWHGLDLLLDSCDSCGATFILHLIGRLSDEQLARAALDKRVVVHGMCSKETIQSRLGAAWVGLSSFALHRKGMKQACTLKVREYLQAGVPVFAGHEDVFPRDFPFYHSGSADMSTILEYARSVRSASRKTVCSESRTHIDKQTLVTNLYLELSGSRVAGPLNGRPALQRNGASELQ